MVLPYLHPERYYVHYGLTAERCYRMDAEDARAWPGELDEPEAWARALEEDGDWVPERLSPGELAAWDDDADTEAACPEAAETAWRALRLMETEEAGRGGRVPAMTWHACRTLR